MTYLITPILLPVVIFFISTASVAMSLQDAGENMLYFEHARLASEYCEKRKISVRPSYEAWEKSNSALYAQAVAAIRTRGAEEGLSGPEQDAVLREVVETQRELAQAHISKKGVKCEQFSAELQMYSSLLKR